MGACQSAKHDNAIVPTPMAHPERRTVPSCEPNQRFSRTMPPQNEVMNMFTTFEPPVHSMLSESNPSISPLKSAGMNIVSKLNCVTLLDCIVHNNLQFPVRLVIQYKTQANDDTHVREFMSFPRTKKILRFRAGVRILAIEANQGWSRATVFSPLVISANSSILLNLMYGDEAVDEIEHFRATYPKRQAMVAESILELSPDCLDVAFFDPFSHFRTSFFPGQSENGEDPFSRVLPHADDDNETCYDTDSKHSSSSLESSVQDAGDFGSTCRATAIASAPFCICGYYIAISLDTMERRPVLYGVCAAARHCGSNSDLY
eukprot:ANDGO_04707.mRNA.1 hypothetical protein